MLRRTSAIVFFSWVLGFFCAPAIYAQISFTRHTINNNLRGAYWVYVKDIDKDGDPDMVTAAFDGIDWWNNNGSQKFSKNFLGSLKSAWGAYAADVTGDGEIDILGCSPGVDEVVMWRNNGSEKFTKVTIDNQGQDPETVFAIDLDGDGDLDVLAAQWVDKQLVWYKNIGGSKFNKYILDKNLSGAHSITAADFDGDGDNDIVGCGSRKTRWYENDGKGNFSRRSLSANGGWSVFAADLDNDGDVDILRTQRNNGDVDWFENNGNAGFSENNIEPGYGECWSIVAGDLDGDGDLDVAGAGFAANNIMVWINNGGGNFSSGNVVDYVAKPRAVYIADLDKDGDGDIAAAIRGDRDLAWYEVNGTPTPAATITVTAPNGGEFITPGSTFNINWNSSGNIIKVEIELSLDSGNNWSTIITGTNNDGSYNWLVPNSPSNRCLIRISDADDSNPSDVSDGEFTIVGGSVPSITSFTPTTGPVGTKVTIFGSNFNNATTVAFNSQSSGFSVQSNNAIQTTVPVGASSGPISVSNSSGSGVSVASFTVTGGGGGNRFVFNPSDDAYTRTIKPGSNYGERTALGVQKGKFKSFLKFNVTGLTGSVNNAVIKLYVTNFSEDGGSVYSVSNNYSGSSSPWDENNITDSNAPVIGGSYLDSAGSIFVGQTIELDVTSAVTGNGIYSFGIQSNSANKGEYSSKEGTVLPELQIQTESGGGTTKYTLTVTKQGSGNVTLNPAGGTYLQGTTVQLTANPDAGWQFNGWSGALSGSANPASITMDNNKTVTATFTPITITQYTLTVFTQGQGSVTLNPAGGKYDEGTVVQLTATPNAGWQFSGWSGNLSGSANPASITMDGNKLVTATFTQIGGGNTFTFNPSDDGQIKVTNSASNYGSKSSTKVAKNKFESYFKFSIAGLGNSVKSARLRLYVIIGSVDGGGVFNVSNNYTGSSTPWVESGLTAGNAPQISGSPLSSVGKVTPGVYVEWDVTSVVNGNGEVSFAIRNNSNDQAKYYTKEGSYQPELVIQTSSGGGTTKYTLSTNIQGSGTVSLSPAGGTYNAGTVVQLTAIPDSGWQFNLWSGALTGSSNPSSLTMDTNKSVTATFTKDGGGGTSVVFTPTDDARTRVNKPDRNYGSLSYLSVQKNVYNSFLKFNVTGLSGNVQSAVLRLYVTNSSNQGGAVYIVSNNFKNNSSSWNEDILNDNNAPLIGGSYLDVAGQVNRGETIDLDVTAAISGNGIVSFGIQSKASNKAEYWSKEGQVPPELIVQTSTAGSQAKSQFTENAIDLSPDVERYDLSMAYPNPFNAETTLQYTLPEATKVRIFVYNIKGQLIRRLVDGFQTSGSKKVNWNGRNERELEVSSGLYFIRFSTGGHTFTRRIILQK